MTKEKIRNYFYNYNFLAIITLLLGIWIGIGISKISLQKICEEQTYLCKRECILEATDIFECPKICEREYNKCINE